jgi:protoheme IX farnesyltransferase
MLPVVASDLETRRAIVAYAVLLLAFSLVPGIWFGPGYTVGAAILGGAFLWMAIRGLTAEGVAWASRLFHFSLAYLGLVFALAAVAAVLPH